MRDPIEQFKEWWAKAIAEAPIKHRVAICVSTIGDDGYPNARLVALKSVDADGFCFCTSYDSVKAQEIERNPKVALTAWWDHVGFQVRVVGTAEKLSRDVAIEAWNSRSRDGKIATLAFHQGEPLTDFSTLQQQFDAAKESLKSQAEIPIPEQWGGYCISPIRIEFFCFRENRCHERELYERVGGEWKSSLLQP